MRILWLATLLSLCSGCSSIIDGPDQYIDLISYPPGATCTVNQAGLTVARIATPGSILVQRSPEQLDVTCLRAGFDPLNAVVPSHFVGDTFGNLMFFPPAIGVDVYDNAIYAYPSQLMLPMPRRDPLAPPRPILAPAMFSQSAPAMAPRPGSAITSTPLAPPAYPTPLSAPGTPAVPVR